MKAAVQLAGLAALGAACSITGCTLLTEGNSALVQVGSAFIVGAGFGAVVWSLGKLLARALGKAW